MKVKRMNEGQEQEDQHFTEEDARVIWLLANQLQCQGLKDMSVQENSLIKTFGLVSEIRDVWRDEAQREFRRLQSIKDKANRIIDQESDE